MTWGQFIDLVKRYRRACRQVKARGIQSEIDVRDELGLQIDQLIWRDLAALATREHEGQKFPVLATCTTMGGFRTIVAIHRYACQAYQRECTTNRLQDVIDSGWSIDELLIERQRRALNAQQPAAPAADLFASLESQPAVGAAEIGGGT